MTNTLNPIKMRVDNRQDKLKSAKYSSDTHSEQKATTLMAGSDRLIYCREARAARVGD